MVHYAFVCNQKEAPYSLFLFQTSSRLSVQYRVKRTRAEKQTTCKLMRGLLFVSWGIIPGGRFIGQCCLSRGFLPFFFFLRNLVLPLGTGTGDAGGAVALLGALICDCLTWCAALGARQSLLTRLLDLQNRL
jgi:hypothetical protein